MNGWRENFKNDGRLGAVLKKSSERKPVLCGFCGEKRLNAVTIQLCMTKYVF